MKRSNFTKVIPSLGCEGRSEGLPLPVCGERVGERGLIGRAQNRGNAPSPGLLRNPTSPRAMARGDLARRTFIALAAAALARPYAARAQLAPNRPVRIIVPFAPAGSSDVLARLLQSPLQQALGQTVIVENRAGAGANIGMVEAARNRTASRFSSPPARLSSTRRSTRTSLTIRPKILRRSPRFRSRRIFSR